ncbi:protein NO VEIN domain-containing protein [Rhodococcus qingshengii]|uniref:protein NO VEIN domain-containing protein n=1 Tax=Rhodococcus qingshengii TaxID=334542 RepID=UPI00365B03FB
MVIQIRLSDRTDHTSEEIESDSLNRSWRGYDPTVNDEELWEHNRGRWILNEAKIAEERYATFVHDDRIVAVYEIHGHERVTDPGPKSSKVALLGRPLASTDPVRQRLVGSPAIHNGRNAVNYVSDNPIHNDADGTIASRAFLLTWNPDNYEWADFAQCVLATQEDGTIDGRWSTGSTKSGIHPGDLVFLLRQGKRGRGIVGSGEAVDFSGDAGPRDEIIYPDAHWNGTGTTANYVDVLWDRLVEPDDILPFDDLKAKFPEQNWSPQASGTQIRPAVIDRLEVLWSEHVGGSRASGRGQGFAVNAAQRKAIEDAAQDWLMQHYRDEGWKVRDTRYSGPYDAVATKNGQMLYLEAKGTQSSGNAVFLTRGEVEHARRHPGDCVIGIWSGMRFTDDGEVDQEEGETLIMSFEPDTGTLTALQYRWEFGADG